MAKEQCLVAGHKGANERRGGRWRSEGESTQESRRRGERHADVEHAERVEEEALRGAVERGERRGVLAEMAAERQRTTPRHRSSDGATRTRGGRGDRDRHREIEVLFLRRSRDRRLGLKLVYC